MLSIEMQITTFYFSQKVIDEQWDSLGDNCVKHTQTLVPIGQRVLHATSMHAKISVHALARGTSDQLRSHKVHTWAH